MIRCLLCAGLALALAAAETPGVVAMGYTRLGPDGVPQGVTVALTRERFAALVAAAAANPAGGSGPDLAVGPGTWTGAWREGRWTFAGSVPVATPGPTWGEARLPMPGTVTAVEALPLAGAAAPPRPAWRMEAGVLVVALPPRTQAVLALTAIRDARSGEAADLSFPPGGTLALDPEPGLVATVGGVAISGGIGLPASAARLKLAVERPATREDSGSLGLVQQLRLEHLGDRIAWQAMVSIDSQRRPPTLLDLALPPRLELLAVRGEELAGWRQRDGRLELRWNAAARERLRSLTLDGVILGDAAPQPALALPGAVRGSGSLGVVDAGPVRWSMPEGFPGLRRIQPGDGERFRLAWDGEAPPGLALPFAATAGQLTAACDGLLVVGAGRWRADIAITLSGAGLADLLRVALPAPWRVVASDGATWLPGEGGGALRATTAIAGGSRLVLHCEAPSGADGLPRIAIGGDGVAAGRVRWLLADRDALNATLTGPASDAEALAADLARAGIRPRPDERLRSAIDVRPGPAPVLGVTAAERRQRLAAAHYLIAGAGAVRWHCHLSVRPEQGVLDRVRIRLPAGVRLADRRGEAVAAWTEADGWLTARFAGPLARPAELDLAFTADWGEAGGRERVELGALTCEPAVDSESVALAEDEEAGQLVRRPDGLEERPAGAIPLPAGVVPALLAGRAWAATGTAWRLALERERLDPGLGADAVASLVDARSAIDPDGRLVSRATWYVINRSRTALDLALPSGCSLWEIRVGGQAVRPRQGAAPDQVIVPVSPLRPGEAATRIQVCWAQGAGEDLRPRMPVFPELRVMRALWRFTAPPAARLVHVDGWEPVPAGDATGARVEVLADELKRLRSSSEESPAVRARLADQLLLIDQELTDHVAVLERLGQDPSRWTGDVAVRRADAQEQALYLQRNSSFNGFANDNRQAVREKLGKLGTVARAQRDRRSGLLLDGQAVRWAAGVAAADAGPDWAARREAQATAGAPETGTVGDGLGPGGGAAGAAATAALTGVDLLPVQDGEELTLRADSLAMQPALRLEAAAAPRPWGSWVLAGAAALALGLALRSRSPRPART